MTEKSSSVMPVQVTGADILQRIEAAIGCALAATAEQEKQLSEEPATSVEPGAAWAEALADLDRCLAGLRSVVQAAEQQAGAVASWLAGQEERTQRWQLLLADLNRRLDRACIS